jgi:hypothetical protein
MPWMDAVPEDQFSAPGPNPQPTPPPPADEIFDAAIRQGSWFLRMLTDKLNSPAGGYGAPVPNYGAWEDIKDNPLWVAHAAEFTGSRSPEQTQAIGRRIAQDAADRKTMAASGPLGSIAQAYAGLLDPTLLLPGRVGVSVLKDGSTFVRGALEVGAAAGVQSSASEAFLRAQHPDRPLSESLTSVGSATILGALLGGAAGFLSPSGRAAIVGKMDAERAAADAHVTGGPSPPPPPAAPTNELLSRLLKSESLTARRTATDLSEAAAGHADLEGKPPGGPPLDVMAQTQQADAANKVHDALTGAWQDYGLNKKPEEDPLTFEEFSQLTGDAMMADGKHDIAQVQRAAAAVKPILADFEARAASDAKLPAPAPGEGLFPHVWDTAKIEADRGAFQLWLKQQLEVGERTKPLVEQTSERELRARARDLTERILATGRSPEGMPGITNASARPWIERDAGRAMQSHLNGAIPETLVTERFGDVEMEKVTQDIAEDYEALAEGKTAAQKAKLDEARDATIADVELLRDQLLGRHQVAPEAPTRNIGRAAAAARQLGDLGAAGLSALGSIPDIARVISRWGLETTFRDAWMPLLKSLTTDQKLAGEAARQAKVMGIAMDTVKAERPATGSPLEGTLQAGADPMQLAHLLNPQIDVVRTVAATVASTELYRAAKAAANGTATKAQLAALERADIPERLWAPIVEHYEKSGSLVDGVLLPNTEAWTHEGARTAFEGAVRRDVNLGVVNPGIDRPSFIGNFVLGMLDPFGLFNTAAATHALAADLPRAEARTLQGIVSTLAYGALSYKIDHLVRGRRTSGRPDEWVREAVERGGLLGYLGEHSRASRAIEGGLDLMRTIGGEEKGRKKDAERSVLGQLVGATTVDKVEEMARGTGATAAGTWTPADSTALRRYNATQNLAWMQRALDQVSRAHGAR